MSLDIEVPITEEIALSEMIKSAEHILHLLLKTEKAMPLVVEELREGITHPFLKNSVLEENHFYLIHIDGEEDIVELTVDNIKDWHLPGSSHDDIATITVRGEWPLKYIIAISLAIALSRKQKTMIIDNEQRWVRTRRPTSNYSYSPDSFFKCILANSPNDLSPSETAKIIYEMMPLQIDPN